MTKKDYELLATFARDNLDNAQRVLLGETLRSQNINFDQRKWAVWCNVKYKITRFYYSDARHRTIKKNMSLSEAQRHCSSPSTRKEGVYFDGYEVQ